MFTREGKFGSVVESWVANELKRHGWACRLMPDWFASFDLLIDEFLPVEVKAAQAHRQHAYGGIYRDRWQFNLSRGLNPGREDFLYILVAMDANGELWPYVIPSAWTVGRTHMPALTSHPRRYRGWMRAGLNAWDLIGQVCEWRRRYMATEAGQLMLPLLSEVSDG